jgi:hypothetical protein
MDVIGCPPGSLDYYRSGLRAGHDARRIRVLAYAATGADARSCLGRRGNEPGWIL